MESQNMKFINDSLHRIMMCARIAVDEKEMTKDEMAAYIPQKANEEFLKVFGMTENQFIHSCLKDMMEELTPADILDMLREVAGE